MEVSNCCGAPVKWYDGKTAVCDLCCEWADVTIVEEDEDE